MTTEDTLTPEELEQATAGLLQPSQDSADTEQEPQEIQEEIQEPQEEVDPYSVLTDKSQQALTDAENLANKWDSLSYDEQAKRVANLSASRPQVFEALAEKMEISKEEMFDHYFGEEKEDPKDDLEARIEAKLMAKLEPQLKQAEALQVDSKIEAFGKFNKLDQEVIDNMKKPDSDVRSTFDSVKYDPKTGEVMNTEQRLEYALRSSQSVQSALIDSRAGNKANRLVKALNSTLPEGGEARTETSLLDIEDPAEFLRVADKLAGKRW